MKILINLAGIMGHDSQEVYAMNILIALLPKLQSSKVYVVTPSYFPSYVFKGMQVRLLVVPGLGNKFFTVFFTQCILPFYMFFLGIDALYSPTTSFPIMNAKYSFPTIHDLDYNDDHEDRKGIAVKYMKILYMHASLKAKKIFVISNAVKQEVIKKYPVNKDNLIVVHNALPIAVINGIGAQYKIDTPYFLYIGIYRARKNIELLIKSYAAICREVAEFLVLAGSVKSNEVYLKKIAREYGCEDRLQFTGYVSEREKNELYKNATALVLPSTYEGFGFPILEANKNEVPIILSDIEIFKEIAGDAAIYFHSNHAESLSRVLKDSTNNKELRARVVAEGKNNLLRFSWDKSADLIAGALNKYE